MGVKKTICCSVLPILLMIILFLNPDYLSEINMPSEAILSGLLALVGFFFGARTFLVFKLQEMVYDNKNYQKWHESLQRDLDLKQDLYEPLKNLDSELNHSVYVCVISTVILSFFIFFNLKLATNTLISPVLLSLLFYNLIVIIFVLYRIDTNIKYIINFWSENYKKQSQ